MKPVGTFFRFCTFLIVLSILGCSSSNPDNNAEPTEQESGGDAGKSAGGTTGGKTKTTRGSGGSGRTTVGQTGQNTGGTPVTTSTSSTASGGSSPQSITGSSPGGASSTGGVSSSLTGGAGTSTGGTSNIGTSSGGTSTSTSTTTQGPQYSVSGKVAGLVGSGLSLSLGSLSSPISITTNGDFSFPNKVPSGSSISVVVATQPNAPRQTCIVSASGTVSAIAQDVTDIAVTCTTNSYAVGGSISGLSGRGLIIKNSTGDTLTLGGNGRFAFPTRISSGQTFTVTIETQPSEPAQTCKISGGSGTIGASDVSSVAVNCNTNTYTIGGTLTGLEGAGVVLRNKDVEDVTVSANGSFAFPTPILSGKRFEVLVATDPISPVQTCEVINGIGNVANSNVSSVEVRCVTNSYLIRGVVSGLVGSGLSLQDNLSDNLTISSNGPFGFSTKVKSGANYSVSVLTQPSEPTQTCTVVDGSGTVINTDISTPVVNCVTNKYTVGGTISGLEGTGLVLRNNGGDEITLTENGNFTFPRLIDSGSDFGVTILTQPKSPNQYCRVVGGRGTIGGANVTSITVNCSAEAHTIGGKVSGLVGSGLTVALNDESPININSNGDFAFPSLITIGSDYAVTLTQHPSAPWQTCTLTNGSGVVGTSDISDLVINCTTNNYAVGGTVTGIVGTGLVLQNLAGDNLSLSSNGDFSFVATVPSGRAYAVTVLTQPTAPSQTCTVTNGTGTIGGSQVKNVQVTCITNVYTVSGTISGLVGSVVLGNNDTDTLKLTANGTFTFASSVPSGSGYHVTVVTEPNSPPQTCVVSAGTGTVVATNVTDVQVTCTTNRYAIGGTVTGLTSGQKLELRNNGIDALIVNTNGAFSFGELVTSGNAYDVTIVSNPSGQYCSVSGGTGTVGASNVTSITVNCSNLRTIGGTVSGLLGSGLKLSNGTEDLSISGSGTFAFKTTQLDGSTYNVTVKTQPETPWQTCTISEGSGVVSSDITTILVTCQSNVQSVLVNVTGLLGSGLVLQNNRTDNLTISSNGISTFATKVASGQDYTVTVLSQPNTPSQTCTVSSAIGTIANTDVTVNVTCVSNNYTIGGKVVGFVGSGLVLLNNGGNSLPITATGTFAFTSPMAGGSNYAVTIGTQPKGFNCGVTNGSGTVGDGSVTNIVVNCPAYTFDIDTQGWGLKSVPTGIAQPTWNNTVGSPNLGALMLDMPAAARCPQVQLMVTPSTEIKATGTTLTAWVRFDTFPNSPVSGDVTFYAQDASWQWNASTYNISSFKVGEWKQLSLVLPSSGNWTKVSEVGLRVQPGGTGCQAARVFVDSVQLQ